MDEHRNSDRHARWDPSSGGAAPQRGRLERHVVRLAAEIGPRNSYHLEALRAAAAFVEAYLAEVGQVPVPQPYEARGQSFANIAAEIAGAAGRRDEVVVVGAHYDSHKDSPGADDNGSAVAALLELARHFAHRPASRTLRFVAFTNEEAPFTRRRDMGSRVYARECRRRGDNIVAMICLESLGFYAEQPGSQWLSLGGLLLPRRGDFLALVANGRSRQLLARVVAKLRGQHESLPYRALVLPTNVPGAWSSDHWSFWREGYPAVMVTDTAPLRNRYYHTREDTPDKVDFTRLDQAVNDLKAVIADLVGASEAEPAR
jgi:Zn-dependent M28 family amino/carboxypeptidase